MTAEDTDSLRDLRVTELLLRIQMRGVADTDQVQALRLEIDLPEQRLRELVSGGLLAEESGLVYVTEHGNACLTEALQGLLSAEELPDVASFADEFDNLDIEVKSVLTAWQHAVRDDDPGAQVAAVQEWLDVDGRLRAAASRSASTARVFGRCLARLEAARERVLDGEPDQLAGHEDSSYHSVWFLLHEMILRVLGRQRTRG